LGVIMNMNTKVYLLYIFLITSIAWECGTDDLESNPREYDDDIDREEEWRPIRIHFEFLDLRLPPNFDAEIRGSFVPYVSEWYRNVLRTQRVKDKIKIKEENCKYGIPIDHAKSGLDADVVIYVRGQDIAESWTARSEICLIEGGDVNRPIAGMYEVNIFYYQQLEYEERLSIHMHQVAHILGFHSYFYEKYQKTSDKQFKESEVYDTGEARGKKIKYIKTPNLLNRARDAFKCSSLSGLELEDWGTKDKKPSHWEKRIMFNDFMTASVERQDIVYSDVTLAFFQDFGWYLVDLTLASRITFGKDEGCNFFSKNCVSESGTEFPNSFCPKQNKFMCDSLGLQLSECVILTYDRKLPEEYRYFENEYKGGRDKYADYCPIPINYPDGNCRGYDGKRTYINPLYGEEACLECRCMDYYIEHLAKNSSGYSAGCYKIDCRDYNYDIIIGSNRFSCPYSGGDIEIPFFESKNYNRTFTCNPYERVCADAPCPYNCNGAGDCLRGGICSCVGGYSGKFCDMICYKTCKSCSGIEKYECTNCFGRAVLQDGECICPQYYEYDEEENRCVTQRCNNQCDKCSRYDGDMCIKCRDNAHIEPLGAKEGTCVCDLGYKLNQSNYTCFECKQYLRSKDIYPYFSEDFESIFINFTQKAAVFPMLKCEDIFEESSLEKLGYDPVCEFKSSNLLVIKLGYYPTIMSENIQLNPYFLFSTGANCTKPEPIQVKVIIKYPIPTPRAVITAPKALSLDCGNDLMISGDSSTGGVSRGLGFNWKFISSPPNSKLPPDSKEYLRENTEVRIPAEDLIESEVTVKLTVLNVFGGMHSVEFPIEVKKEGAISIIIEGGDKFTIFNNQPFKIDASLQDSCFPEDEILWKLELNTLDGEANSDLNLEDFFKDSSFIFKPYSIPPGHTYEFIVKATHENAKGSATVGLKVLYPGIVVVLSKNDGEVSVKSELVISAMKSYDPAFQTEQELKFRWRCFNIDQYCITIDDTELTFNSNSTDVRIPSGTLKPGEDYEFEVTVSNGIRKATKSVKLKAVDIENIRVISEFSGAKVRPEDGLVIIPSISAQRTSTFLWVFSKGSYEYDIPTNLSYISIPENTLTPGLSYTLDLIITDEYRKTLKTSYSWLVNLGPKGDFLEVSPTEGVAFEDKIVMNARNFIDGDGEDLPIYYQFGAIVNETEYPFHAFTFSNKYSTVLFAGSYEVYVKVCDSMFTCMILTESVEILGGGKMSCGKITEEFRKNTQSLNKVVQNIVNYLISYKNCDDFFNVAESKFEDYMKDFTLPGSVTIDALAATVSLLLRDVPSMNDKQLESFTEFILDILKINSRYLRSNHAIQLINSIFRYYTDKTLTTISQFNEKLLKILYNNKLPNENLLKSELGPSFIYRSRIRDDSLNSLELESSRFKVEFSDDSPLPTGYIYDLQITGFPDANEKGDILDLALYKVGTYDNVNLVIDGEYVKQEVLLKSPITISMTIHLSEARRLINIGCGCVNKESATSEGCKIKEISGGVAKISINRLCRVTFKDPDPEDDEGELYSYGEEKSTEEDVYDPIYAMIGWLALLICIFGVSFYINRKVKDGDDKKGAYIEVPKQAFKDTELTTVCELYLRYHLTFSIGSKLDPYPLPRLMTLGTVVLVEYCLVGILYRFIGNSEESIDGEVLEDYDDVIGYVLISLTITLPYTILVLVQITKLFVYSNNGKQVRMIFASVIPVMLVSIGGVIVLNILEFNQGPAKKWAVSIIWIILLEIFAYQSIISLILSISEKILRARNDKFNRINNPQPAILTLNQVDGNNQPAEDPMPYPPEAPIAYPKVEAIKVPKIKKRKRRNRYLSQPLPKKEEDISVRM
jgi:hypothetical protein